MRTLTGDHNDRVTDMAALILEPIVLESNQNHANITYAIDHVVCGGGNCTAQGPCYYEEISPTLKAGGVHGVAYTVDMGGGKSSVCTYQEQSPTLTCTHYGEPTVDTHSKLGVGATPTPNGMANKAQPERGH